MKTSFPNPSHSSPQFVPKPLPEVEKAGPFTQISEGNRSLTLYICKVTRISARIMFVSNKTGSFTQISDKNRIFELNKAFSEYQLFPLLWRTLAVCFFGCRLTTRFIVGEYSALSADALVGEFLEVGCDYVACFRSGATRTLTGVSEQ